MIPHARQERPPTDELATWNVERLRRNLFERLQRRARQEGLELTPKRIAYEVDHDADCPRLMEQWRAPECDRVALWQDLLELGARACKSPSATCVRCGQCCRNASPILYSQDLLLVRREQIPLRELVTLRVDEPATSPFADQPFTLTSECIKVREKPGSSECVFFDSEQELCSIHEHRPHQCLVQACWDESPVERLMSQRVLTRRELFAGVGALIEIMDDHDRRCSFARLVEAFENLEKSKGATIDEVVELIAYEDLYRAFMAERAGLPEAALDLFFGRSLASRVRLFGFRVDEGADGSRTLVAEGAASPAAP